MDTIRDAPLGQIIRLITRNKFLPYPEEVPDFKVPYDLAGLGKEARAGSESPSRLDRPTEIVDLEQADAIPPAKDVDDLGDVVSDRHPVAGSEKSGEPHTGREITAQPSWGQSIRPHTTNDGKILVTWYSSDDPENPQQWSSTKKAWTGSLIWSVSVNFSCLLVPPTNLAAVSTRSQSTLAPPSMSRVKRVLCTILVWLRSRPSLVWLCLCWVTALGRSSFRPCPKFLLWAGIFHIL